MLTTTSEATRGTAAADVSLGRVVLLVHDYDVALDFYRAALGAEPIFDQPTPSGDRYLHLGLPGQAAGDGAGPPVGLWLLRATGDDAALVGRQAAGHPLLVLYTGDCDAAVERFVRAGGSLRQPARTEAGARFAHVADLYGNELLLVQMQG